MRGKVGKVDRNKIHCQLVDCPNNLLVHLINGLLDEVVGITHESRYDNVLSTIIRKITEQQNAVGCAESGEIRQRRVFLKRKSPATWQG